MNASSSTTATLTATTVAAAAVEAAVLVTVVDCGKEKKPTTKIFYKHVHRKLSILHENTPRILRLDSILTNKDNEPSPVLGY